MKNIEANDAAFQAAKEKLDALEEQVAQNRTSSLLVRSGIRAGKIIKRPPLPQPLYGVIT